MKTAVDGQQDSKSIVGTGLEAIVRWWHLISRPMLVEQSE